MQYLRIENINLIECIFLVIYNYVKLKNLLKKIYGYGYGYVYGPVIWFSYMSITITEPNVPVIKITKTEPLVLPWFGYFGSIIPFSVHHYKKNHQTKPYFIF